MHAQNRGTTYGNYIQLQNSDSNVHHFVVFDEDIYPVNLFYVTGDMVIHGSDGMNFNFLLMVLTF